MTNSAPSSTEKIDAISRELAEFASSFKASTKLSWVLIMATIQASIGNVYVQLLGKSKACERLEEYFTPLQQEYGPRQQTFDDTATLTVPYSQLPQFIMFNAAFGEFVRQLCTKHATEHVVFALERLLIDIAVASLPGNTPQGFGVAIGVRGLMQVCRDIRAGYYDICEF